VLVLDPLDTFEDEHDMVWAKEREIRRAHELIVLTADMPARIFTPMVLSGSGAKLSKTLLRTAPDNPAQPGARRHRGMDADHHQLARVSSTSTSMR
jgi:hypothetical protein